MTEGVIWTGDLLGARFADSKDFLFWEDLFDNLNERGFKDVKLIFSDGYKGIQKAVRLFY